MKISPLDVRKQTFRTVFRGADSEEVRVFLDLAATEYENALQENQRLTERLRNCEDRLVEYRELDQMLRNSLLTAERFSAEAKEASQHEAEMVIQEAEWRAKQILEDARERLGRLAEEIRELQSRKNAFSQHLRSFLQAHMELLDRNEDYLDGVDRLADDIHEMASRARQTTLKASSPQASASSPEAPVSRPRDSQVSIPPEERDDGLPESIPGQEEAPAASGWARASAARGLGRFGRGDAEGGSEETQERSRANAPARAAKGEPEKAREQRSAPERSEGLFEISAEEDDPQRG